MEERHYFMVGMPAGGKTSYIVRLYSQLIMNECDMIYSLSDGEIPEGYTYIKEQINKMESCQKIMRTLENVYYDMTLSLVDKKNEKLSLVIPDLSGEYYRRLVDERFISKIIADRLKQADEILFFINTETMEKEDRLEYDKLSTVELIENLGDDEKQKDEDISGAKVIESEKATQSQVVELLQIILNLVRKKTRIKFVISAWDRIEKKIPEEKKIPDGTVYQDVSRLLRKRE